MQLEIFEADPFQRGVPNGLAYALGLEPAAASPGMLTQGIKDGGRFALTFTRPVGRQGLIYQVEATGSLASPWELVPSESFTVIPNHDGTETVIARDPTPPGESNRQFLRLRVLPE